MSPALLWRKREKIWNSYSVLGTVTPFNTYPKLMKWISSIPLFTHLLRKYLVTTYRALCKVLERGGPRLLRSYSLVYFIIHMTLIQF